MQKESNADIHTKIVLGA